MNYIKEKTIGKAWLKIAKLVSNAEV